MMRELVLQLLAATPLPPPSADVDELLAAHAELHRVRQAILDAGTPELDLGADGHDLGRELLARDAAWLAALRDALTNVRSQRRGVSQVRAYAATLASGL